MFRLTGMKKVAAPVFDKKLVTLTISILFAPLSIAEPSIHDISLTDPASFGHDGSLVVKGGGFGDKERAEPVLYDHVDHAYEYGERSSAYSALDDMDSVPSASEKPGGVWASVRSSVVRYQTSGQHRHVHSSASYFLDGENAWLGRPTAYGGVNGWDTPSDNPQLYVSWWYKPKYNGRFYWRYSPQDEEGTFVAGEEIKIGDEGITGQYIGVDEDGLHNAVIPGQINDNRIGGKAILGVSSGAKGIFPDHHRGSGGSGWLRPGSKYLRVWDDPSGSKGIRASMSDHDFYVYVPKDKSKGSGTISRGISFTPNEWHHFEFEIDTDRGFVRTWLNGQFRGEGEFGPDAHYIGKYSPTPSLIGVNSDQAQMQESHVSDIYFDNTLQRVVIGNASRYSEVSHVEVQRPTRWEKTEIEIKVNLGALDVHAEDLFLYVFDKNGTVNPEGIPICEFVTCSAAPGKIDLTVD